MPEDKKDELLDVADKELRQSGSSTGSNEIGRDFKPTNSGN